MQERCNSTKIFGKTFHKNMSVTDLQKAWKSVPEEAKKGHKDIENIINQAVRAENAAKEVVQAYENAKKALKTQQDAAVASAASSALNPAYAIAKAAANQAEEKLNNLVDSFTNAYETVMNTIETRLKEAGGCKEEDEKELEKQNVL